MNLDAHEISCRSGLRTRTFSNSSEQSSKLVFPFVTSDSGLYTCSSNTSDCSFQLESDTDSCLQSNKISHFKNDRLQLALQELRKLRSELERLTKSEQWYKEELKQQKSTRLDDLERIYTQERKFMQENQRLQKECVRLYEKCNELERELEKQNHISHDYHILHLSDEERLEENMHEFEKEQHLNLLKDQQQLISVLRKQKRSLLEDIRSLAAEKDEKVTELQRLLADLEFDNKLITKKCSQFAKERLKLENNLNQSDSMLSIALQDKINLQKSIADLKDQVAIQQELLSLKEGEIEHIQQHYTDKIKHEQDLDLVHELSMKYQEQINTKTLDIINLKQRVQEMHDELEEMQNLQEQNDLQQRQIAKLNFSLEAYRLELHELKTIEQNKDKQLNELHAAIEHLIKDKEIINKTALEQRNELLHIKQNLQSTQEQCAKVQELYKKTQFQLELLQVEQGKLQFQKDGDRQEIAKLRNKLKEYLQQTTILSDKVRSLENELAKILRENINLKRDYEQMENCFKDFEEKNKSGLFQKQHQSANKDDTNDLTCQPKSFSLQQEFAKNSYDQDFIDLQEKCKKLLNNIDFIRNNTFQLETDKKLPYVGDVEVVYNGDQQTSIELNRSEYSENNNNLRSSSGQYNQLQEHFDKLNIFLGMKPHLFGESNNSNENVVTENEILKKKLSALEAETLRFQIKEDITEGTKQFTKMKENLENHVKKVSVLQENLLRNDGKLYKLERKLRTIEEADESQLKELQAENKNLQKYFSREKASKAELSEKLIHEREKLNRLENALEDLKTKRTPTKNQAVQCLLLDNFEIKELREQVVQLRQERQDFQDQESYNKEERLQFLHQIIELQNNKVTNLQTHQKDWQDILTGIINATSLQDNTRKELELKRMELEELNQVFAEQNEQLAKLEKYTAILEIQMQQEKEQLKLTFLEEINVMKQQLQDCQNEIENQKLANQLLKDQNSRFQQDINVDFAGEVAEYKKEIRELKSRVSRIIEEKENLLQSFKELEQQTKDLKDNKREAIIMPDFSLEKITDIYDQTPSENMQVLQQNVNEDHFRILTKVLEAEYQRKMLRYDNHIHSLLSNMANLKKSLKCNEAKTASLNEEQLKTKEELKGLQTTKRSLEEIRLKYEESQNTIKKLKDTLALHRSKFEFSDLGKFTHQSDASYEVSNLIDDYKKLIHQSAWTTKRPSTSAIMDLIQRSKQCVPNLDNLETNVESLRCDMDNFLTSYKHRIPCNTLIATDSLSVPLSLMDELRVASERF